jgi:hypothetical protein
MGDCGGSFRRFFFFAYASMHELLHVSERLRRRVMAAIAASM